MPELNSSFAFDVVHTSPSSESLDVQNSMASYYYIVIEIVITIMQLYKLRRYTGSLLISPLAPISDDSSEELSLSSWSLTLLIISGVISLSGTASGYIKD